MSNFKDYWWAMMREKYQTDDAGVRQIMRDRQQLSMDKPGRKHVGGFKDPQKAREAAKLSVQVRRSKKLERLDTKGHTAI